MPCIPVSSDGVALDRVSAEFRAAVASGGTRSVWLNLVSLELRFALAYRTSHPSEVQPERPVSSGVAFIDKQGRLRSTMCKKVITVSYSST